MRKIQYEDAEEGGWDEEYDKIVFLLNESIQINLEEIEDIYKDVSSPNKYTIMLYIEALAKMGEKFEARLKFEELKNLVDLPQDLNDYFLTLIK